MQSTRKIRVLIAKPGLDSHDRGAKVVARALRDAGMEVIYTGLRQTPEQIVETALQEDVNVIGLSILSGAHKALFPRIMASIYPSTGRAQIIGLTGPAGSGKSTLIEKIVREYRRKGKTVGVIAVDPTSPFTGGAFLGDRIRMQELSTDLGVFIRSMATRNYLGGIAKATKDAVKVLDAAGKEIIIVETVGAGQSEVEIIKVAQTIVVIHAPGLGDEIQAIKAGIMEIADIFVVNKADRENANKAVMDIQSILQLNNKEATWKPPILKTTALTGEGVPELIEKIEEHRRFLEKEIGRKRSLGKAEAEFIEAIKEKVVNSIIDDLKKEGRFEEFLEKIIAKEMDPASAAEKLLHEKLRRH